MKNWVSKVSKYFMNIDILESLNKNLCFYSHHHQILLVGFVLKGKHKQNKKKTQSLTTSSIFLAVLFFFQMKLLSILLLCFKILSMNNFVCFIYREHSQTFNNCCLKILKSWSKKRVKICAKVFWKMTFFQSIVRMTIKIFL